MVDLSCRGGSWIPPILETIATTGEGARELTEKVLAHKGHLQESGILTKKRSQRIREEVIDLIELEIAGYIHEIIKNNPSFDEAIEKIVAMEKEPYSFVREITAPLAAYFKIKR